MLSTGHLGGFCNLSTYGGPQGWGQGEDKPIKWERQSEPSVIVLSLPSSYVCNQLWWWICVLFLPCDEHPLHLCFRGKKTVSCYCKNMLERLDIWISEYIYMYQTEKKMLETRWKRICLSRSIRLKGLFMCFRIVRLF